MRKITTGDDVIVVAGKDKGRRGTVRQILDDKAVVDGVNVARKHQKGNPNAGVTGGIVDKEMPIDISNLMVFNPATGCLLYTSPSPRDATLSRMPSSA